MTEFHPIQLLEIVVTRLSCEVNDPVKARDFIGEIDLTIENGLSDIEPENPQVAVGIRATVIPDGEDQEGATFKIHVELNGQFHVDLEKFKFENLESWSTLNAPFLLMPYLREQIYGLALRAGIRKLIIPLFIQPQRPITLEEQKKMAAEKKVD